jgi:hypothetical protein
MRSERRGTARQSLLGRLRRIRRLLRNGIRPETDVALAVPTSDESRKRARLVLATELAVAQPPYVESKALQHAEQLATWDDDGGASTRTRPVVPQPTAARDTRPVPS